MTQPGHDFRLVPTELINPDTVDIDLLATPDVLERINIQDRQVPEAVAQAIPAIAKVVDRIVDALGNGGHLFYFGAGTSGRLGVLDAAECPPTFGTDPDRVQAFIAGGARAMTQAVEGAEDSSEQGRADVESSGAATGDVVVGISASGGAPYVVAAMETARERGCFTAAITCHGGSKLARTVDQAIVVEAGPEVIAGSTRMKAGTAQKLVLNMLTTASMIQLGKTYENLMVDVRPTNRKLRERARRIVSALAGAPEDQAARALEETAYQVKPAVLMLRLGLSAHAASEKLRAAGGKLRAALLQSD